jgi:predicted nucleotide-binding protein
MGNPRRKDDAQDGGEQAKSQGQPRRYVYQSDVPRCSLGDALRIPMAISDNYAKAATRPLDIAAALNIDLHGTQFRTLCGASSAYGLTDGGYKSDTIALTELGRRIVAPTVEGDELVAEREAFLKPRVIHEFLTNYHKSKFPPNKIALNVLEQMGVPKDATAQTFKLILDSAKELNLLGEINGQLWVDLDSELRGNDASTEAVSEESVPSVKLLRLPTAQQGDISQDPIRSNVNRRVFVTHGKNKEIVTQLKDLLTFGKFEPVVAEEHETVSKPVPEKVMDDMRSCAAGIIHVGKDTRVLDQDGNEHSFLNQNVLIEIGASMALYGGRFILLVEEGVTLPSNLQGLYVVRCVGEKLDYEATMKLLKAFNDFGI